MTDQKLFQQPAALCGWFCLALLSIALCWPAMTQARDIHQDEVLTLTEQGIIQPLQVFITDALTRYPGRFLKAELEWDDGRYIYELELVTHSRKVMELEYDAATGRLLDVDEDD